MRKRIVGTLLISVLILSSACEEKKETDSSADFYGKWKLVSMSMIMTIDGLGTFEETEDYSSKGEAFWAFFDFGETTVGLCENDLCETDYECDNVTVDYNDGSIVLTGLENDATSGSETYSYSFSGNTLTLSSSYVESEGSINVEIVMEKYTGTFPPVAWSGTADVDAYEPDNNLALANAITIGATGQDHEYVCSPDFVKFDADSGNSYRIDVDSDFDTYITLYNSNGDEIDYNDDAWPEDDEGNEYDATLEWDCDSTGTYFVEITDYGYHDDYEDYDEYGPYNVTVELVSGSAKMLPAFEPIDKTYRKLMKHPFWK